MKVKLNNIWAKFQILAYNCTAQCTIPLLKSSNEQTLHYSISAVMLLPILMSRSGSLHWLLTAPMAVIMSLASCTQQSAWSGRDTANTLCHGMQTHNLALILLVRTDSAKKELSKTDGLCPRYKQPCGVGVHVDISTHRQEGVNINKWLNTEYLET